MKVAGWGNYPTVDATVTSPRTPREVLSSLSDNRASYLIGRGLGRSYGDSALAGNILDCRHLDHLLRFDPANGALTCAGGATLADILSIIVPAGWFLPVTPGTKFVTVGGAIASDVHGKNHHVDGCFSDHVTSFKLATPMGEIECSRETNDELFRATCGGMGLTGLIVEASLRLRAIGSALIEERIIKTRSLDETLDAFDHHAEATYSVAWIDCLAKGASLGRSLLMLGEHAGNGKLTTGKPSRLALPFNLPSGLLNHYSVRLFNELYYHRVGSGVSRHLCHYEPFFYPLDSVRDWNRVYGRRGFTQYQFAIPREGGREGMRVILERIAESGQASFLSVLKAFGAENKNLLSFPMSGYTLALDFSINRQVLSLLDELDSIVLDLGGRLYLAKDARMSESTFQRCYPRWQEFNAIREKYGADRVFRSLQSHRLGL